MTSSHQQLEDGLGCLVREALNTWVGTQEPPEYVWKRIVAKLEKEQTVAMSISDHVPSLSHIK
jgi:hypothetical protein